MIARRSCGPSCGKPAIRSVKMVLDVGRMQGFNAWARGQAETSADLYHQALAADDADAIAGSRRRQWLRAVGAVPAAAAHAAANNLYHDLAYAALAADKAVPALYQQAAQLLAVMNAPAGSDIGALQDSLSLVEGGWQPLARIKRRTGSKMVTMPLPLPA